MIYAIERLELLSVFILCLQVDDGTASRTFSKLLSNRFLAHASPFLQRLQNRNAKNCIKPVCTIVIISQDWLPISKTRKHHKTFYTIAKTFVDIIHALQRSRNPQGRLKLGPGDGLRIGVLAGA